MKVLVINGPNLQLLGVREPDVYGRLTLKDIEEQIAKKAYNISVEVEFFQSNHEGEILDKISEAYYANIDGIVINPAAFTHTSVAILDALKAVNIPTIEVHISNIHKREEFRHKSITAAACVGQISGLGVKGYELALEALVDLINK